MIVHHEMATFTNYPSGYIVDLHIRTVSIQCILNYYINFIYMNVILITLFNKGLFTILKFQSRGNKMENDCNMDK